ncbi:MAG: methyltransferase domain-containing protein [Nitrospirae bacterium]|nr:methyltransferase domain-containing protein [Nitrospirota bacterium]
MKKGIAGVVENNRHDFESVVVSRRSRCAVCGDNGLEPVIDLPGLPLTDKYSDKPMSGPVGGIDQQLLVCCGCGHAQLADQVDPGFLYGANYNFRTSASASSRQGTDFFLSVLESLAPGRRFKCILDLGCNDLHLLKQLKEKAGARVGIDPLWASREEQRDDMSIDVIGDVIEDVDLGSLKPLPDLILSRHTLEHIHEPAEVLGKLLDAADDEALFLFEVPGFETLMRRMRFDQVFHQHLQYFTIHSFRKLLEEAGGEYISHRQNHHNWGTLLVAFRKRRTGEVKCCGDVPEVFNMSAIRRRYDIFRRQMSASNEVLESFRNTTVYGYGAAQMLSVLSYHLGNDLSMLTAVMDDDPSRDGIYYWNLPVVIRHPDHFVDITDATVIITAVDSVKPILGKLLDRRPGNVIYPFHIM